MVRKFIGIMIVIIILFMAVFSLYPDTTDQHKNNDSPKMITKIREKDGMVMVYIPEGEFSMGSTIGESLVFLNFKLFAFPDQRPKHKVFLDGYWIDQTEVTVGMFKKFIEVTGHKTSAEKEGWGKPWRDGPKEDEWPMIPGTDWLHPQGPESITHEDHPVVQVSWEDAIAYVKWIGGSLPTEAQWEKAARGTDGRRFPWGDEFDGNFLNYGDSLCPVGRWRDHKYNDGYAYTSPVGSYPDGASPYGVLDMAGNVWEWVADWYYEDYYENSTYQNPVGPFNGQVKAQRGGSWYDGEPEAWVNCVVRHQNPVNDRYEDVGFRCVMPAKKGEN
ncbi:formylglycine-generating enzyme family protein [Bacteroidota bacterium]